MKQFSHKGLVIIFALFFLTLSSGCSSSEEANSPEVEVDKGEIENSARNFVTQVFQVDEKYNNKDFKRIVHSDYFNNPNNSVDFLKIASQIYETGEGLRVVEAKTENIWVNNDQATVNMELLLEERAFDHVLQQTRKWQGLLRYSDNEWLVISDHFEKNIIEDTKDVKAEALPPLPLSPEGKAAIDDLLEYFEINPEK